MYGFPGSSSLTGIERFVMNGTGIVMKLHERNGMTWNGQSKTQWSLNSTRPIWHTCLLKKQMMWVQADKKRLGGGGIPRRGIQLIRRPPKGEQGVLDATMERCETPSPWHAAAQTGKNSWAEAFWPLPNPPRGSAHSAGRCWIGAHKITFFIFLVSWIDKTRTQFCTRKMLVASSPWCSASTSNNISKNMHFHFP